MNMTTSVSETNAEPINNPYAGLPKPPMAPPSKATAKIQLILSPSEVSFPSGMGRYLGNKGIRLETLQFDTERLLVGSIRGGNLSPHNQETECNLFFLLRGIRVENTIVLRVVEAPSEGEIAVGDVFCDIDENNCLVPDSDLHKARYPIISLQQEVVNHGG